MHIIDISWPIFQGITEYKNRTSIHITQYKFFKQDRMRQSSVAMDNHSGTHVDAPSHFVEHGATIDQVPLDKLIGSAILLDMTEQPERISRKNLEESVIQANQIVLLKTKNSFSSNDASFNNTFVYLESEAAKWLADQNVKAVGIDYLGIERNQPDHETHTSLLQAGIPIIEGLRLAHVKPGVYFFCCLPLAIVGADAAPARAVLFDNAKLID